VNLATETSWAAYALAFGVDLAVKATIILVFGLIVQLAAGRRWAALGSTVGNACLLGLLLLPCSARLLPPLKLAWLPAGARAPGPKAHPPALAITRSTSPDDAAVDLSNIEPARDRFPIDSKRGIAPLSWSSERPPIPLRSANELSGPATTSAGSRTVDWLAVGMAGYALVTVALLIRLLASLAAVERLRRDSIPVTEPAWSEALKRCRRRLGIAHEVGLAWSPRLSVPIVLGWTRSTVLLPVSLSSLDPCDHAEAILLHELSHVRRGDYRWNVVLRLVQALYWPHPLIWWLGRVIAEVREQVCDDVCVHELGDPSSYGETLLAVATKLTQRPGADLGLAMARTSNLGRRLARIAQFRGTACCLPRLPARLLIITMAVTIAGALGAAQLTRAEARPTAIIESPATSQPAAPPREGGERVFRLQVVAADTGRPVPNANVRILGGPHDDWRKADAEGRLDIVHSTGPADRWFWLDIWGDGRAMQRHKWGLEPTKPIPDGEVVRLQPGESLGGVVQDEGGRPIAGAEVYLWSHNYKRKDPHELLFDLRAISGPDGRWRTSGAPETTGELLGIRIIHPDYLSTRDYGSKEIIPKIADLRADKAVTVMKKGVPIEGRVVDAQGHPVAGAVVLSADHKTDTYPEVARFAITTDDKGHFRTGQVKAGEWIVLAQARGHAPGVSTVKIDKAIPQVEIALGRPRTFRGRVADPSGHPIAEARLGLGAWRGYNFLGTVLYTDAEGRFQWDDAPDDELTVNVQCPGYTNLFMQRINPTDEGVSFTLRRALEISGTVRDAETSQRVERARVEFGAVDPKTGDVARWSSVPRNQTGILRGILNVNFPAEADAYKIRLTAGGYAPFISRAFRRDEKVVVDYDINLVPGRPSGPLATVLRPDGKPLAGARVYSTQRNEEGLNVVDGVVTSERGGRELLTGPDGTFPIPPYDDPFLVLIVSDDVYAYASKKTLSDSPEVQARPYGRVEGRFHIGNRAVSKQAIRLSAMLQNESTMRCNLYFRQDVTTDAEGRFAFEKVIPIPHLRVERRDPSDKSGWTWSLGEPVHVAPGETTRATIGGKGRPVIGRIEPPEGWTQPVDFTAQGGAAIESNRPFVPYPLELFRGKTTLDGGYWFDWSDRWRRTPEGIAYVDSRVAAHVGLAPDGSFRIDDLPAGEYRLTIHAGEDQGGRDRGPFARINREFAIPPIPGGRSDEPFDLGTFRLKTRSVPKAGEPAPDFEVKTVDGKAITLKEYRGKYLLLDFGVLWDDQSRFQVARLNDIQKRFGNDPRFAILSLVMAPDDARTRAFIAGKGQRWPQAIIGPLTNPIASAYGIEGHYFPFATIAILIGPDGKIVARDLSYNKIGEAIGQALGRPGQ
jgi:beta-lactamase regulating signal transducer with metallopeptidase domain/uncharacterized GH25 family protein